MKKFFFIFSIALLIISCEEEMVPIPEIEVPASDRVVLLEDLTGVKCPNCPKAAVEIERLAEKFGENLAAIAIHGLQQASPLPESKYDFRNPKAQELEFFHSPNWGKPSVAIDRVHFEEEDFVASISDQNWETYIVRELEKPVEVNLNLNVSFDENSREVSIETFAVPTRDLSGTFKISVFITESHIEDAQEYPTFIDEEYIHHHVLRDMLTAFDGDILASELTKGVEIRNPYQFTLPQADMGGPWNPDHVEIVVAISEETGTTKEIIQAAKSKLK